MSSDSPTLYVAEPPPRYLPLPPLVVDCSTLAGLVFNEEWRAQALERLQGRSLHAPNVLQAEIASVAIKKQRRGEGHAATGLAEAARLDITLHRMDVQAVAALALQYNLSACDASYLWLAAELQCPLATFDDKLAKAAQAHLSTLS